MAEFENDTFVEEGGEGPSGMPDPLEIHLVIAAQCVIGIVGLFGGILALYHYIRRGERRTHIIGVLTLTAKNLLDCSIVLPHTIYLEANQYRMSNDFLCKMGHLVDNANIFGILFLFMVFAIERCACICHDPRHSMRWKAAVAAAIVTLVVALGLGLVPALGAGIWHKVQIDQGDRNSTNSTLELTSAVKSKSSQLRKVELCGMNDLIISFDALLKFDIFFLFFAITSGTISLVAYVIIFVVVVYRRYRPTPNIILFTKDQNTGVDVQAGNRAVAADIANSECKELEDEKKTQRTFGLMFFALTAVFWITLLPGMLMFQGHIRGRLALFMMHQIPYGINPLVYLAIDTDFRQEAKGLFQSTWSKFRE